MKSIEESFKNRISFISHSGKPIPDAWTYTSKNVFNPEGYSIDFLKKKLNHFVIIYIAT